MQSDDESTGGADGTLGRIALKQVRVSRAEAEARSRETSSSSITAAPAPAAARQGSGNPMNRLVPYLDLFDRLTDEELSRLARAPSSAVEGLRQQVDEVNRALSRYVDLLVRLSDDELVRLTGATAKTIRFWRLSQPRHLQGEVRRSTGESASTSQVGQIPAGLRREPSSAQSSDSMRRDETLASEHDHHEPAGPSSSGSATFVMDID